MTSHPAYRSLSACAWHVAAANTCDISTAAGETQWRLRGNLMFSTWNRTGWQQPWNLYLKVLLMWGLMGYVLLTCVVQLSLWAFCTRELWQGIKPCAHAPRDFVPTSSSKNPHTLKEGLLGVFRPLLSPQHWRADLHQNVLFCTWTPKTPSTSQLCCLVVAHRNCDLNLVCMRYLIPNTAITQTLIHQSPPQLSNAVAKEKTCTMQRLFKSKTNSAASRPQCSGVLVTKCS